MSDELQVEEHCVAFGEMRLFVKTWTPSSWNSAPILLFHDSLGCTALWRTFPELLARQTRRQVVSYDRLGFGRSDPYAGTLAFTFISDEARTAVPELMSQLGLPKFIACGHSVGGAMAIEVAAALPASTSAVITIAAQAFVENKTIDSVGRARQEMNSAEALAKLARHHGGKAKWALDAWTETWLDPAFRCWSLDPALRKVGCPIMAIHGDRDEYGSIEHARRIAHGRGRVQILPGIGHVPHRESEAILVDTISRFLERIA
jgi:pimeloyl-ACP methyl ester carboxylesterase